MSSVYVRTQIKQFLDDNSNEDVVDMTAQFEDLRQLLAEYSIQPDASWLGLQFNGNDEVPVSLSATNDVGLYRETGIVQLHVVSEARIGVGDSLLARGEVLRNLFRGRRIGNIVIESVSPVNTEAGTTLEFEDGYMSGTCIVTYYCDLNL
jgi:hypothetical protein